MFRGLSTMRCAATTSLLSRGWLQTLTHTTKPSTGYAVARVLIAPLSISSSNAKGVEEVTVRNPVIEDYPVVQTLDVQWGEMDAFQHVNNVTYFRYFETARMEYFERIQYLQHMDKGKGGPILGETTCKYVLCPALLFVRPCSSPSHSI
ncbi:hypothetical protein SARC_08364 [Sphaeroforma arctica JP610]|uniref:Thioesterase domain-containing protein n=1 Tax=Sphaeroforma arctica JP610 TaxID=667725 RepID=A0A0L0FR47_9EUKA|nr:hypothetical protein SARC_08364 [Sphaeroforma arctica JP610]KNC79240.1 hypothetical protein SARC_08364 [Sphaeroforma arctica JP610]|eukprot:XP_014153142.1 hypothetical protein SARC_08364 [Sphaeroforma arctica JP610]